MVRPKSAIGHWAYLQAHGKIAVTLNWPDLYKLNIKHNILTYANTYRHAYMYLNIFIICMHIHVYMYMGN